MNLPQSDQLEWVRALLCSTPDMTVEARLIAHQRTCRGGEEHIGYERAMQILRRLSHPARSHEIPQMRCAELFAKIEAAGHFRENSTNRELSNA